MEPQVLARWVNEHVRAEIDDDAWHDAHLDQDRARKALKAVADRWDDVTEFLGEQD